MARGARSGRPSAPGHGERGAGAGGRHVAGARRDPRRAPRQRHGRGTVTVTARNASGSVALDIGDEGDGFAANVEDAFERRAGAGNGHGIGLALARSLALAEDGRLDVTHPGPGPIVTLLLPRP
ncbi:MAG: ATP-binding protein [Thermoleophilaceae bacterium]